MNTEKKYPNLSMRLVIGLIILLTITLVINLVYYRDTIKSYKIASEIIDHPYTVSNKVHEINADIVKMHRSMKDVVLAKNEAELNQAIEDVNEYEKIVLEKFTIVFDKFLGDKNDVTTAHNLFMSWKPIRDEVIGLVKKKELEKAADITKGKGAKHVELLLSKTGVMIDFASIKAREFIANTILLLSNSKRKATIFIIYSILVGLLVFIWIIRSINKPLDNIISRIKNIPQNQLINKLPENEKNKLALIDFVFKELEDQKKHLEIQVNERTKELQETKNLLEDAFENASTGMVMINFEGHLINVNQAFCNFIGYSEKELLLMKLNDLTHADDIKTGTEYVKEIIEGKIKNSSFDKRYIHKSGNILHGSVSSSLVKDANNKPLHLFVQIKDIAKQKQLEIELTKHKEHLEEIVEKRTKLLDEKAKKLNDSQQAMIYLVEDVNESRDELKMLNEQIKATNKELEAFSYSVSHDLRAPLRGINGFTQILIEDYGPKLDDEGKRVCNVIKENSHKMGHLIDDLLTFSRLSRVDIQKSTIDMGKMVNSIFYEITSEESRKKIILEIGDLCNPKGDAAMLKQVWTNLLSNAIKFSSKKDKALISVTCKKDKEKYVYCIKDNGAGFDMKYVDKLFGVFHRLHSANEFDGTGVGLANVQRIVIRHGGEVWADGEVDKGASFYFSLPIIMAIE